MTKETATILAALGAALTLATLIGLALHWRVRDGKARATVDNLNARIRAWWLMVAAVGGALLAGRSGLIALFAIASFFALREFLTLTPTRRADHRALFACFFVALPLQYALIWFDWYGLFSIFLPVYGFLLLPFLAVTGADTRQFLARSSETQWGVMTCVYCISYVPALLTLKIANFQDRGAMLVVFLLVVVQSSDVLQYVWGKLFGRHKIAPATSPSKTVEGFVGGVASAVGVGALLHPITPFTLPQAAGMALAITLMGFAGGLVMSAIKRDLGVKDWGDLIEGHGGMLDRLDSVCFSAPVFFHLTRYFFEP